MLAGLLGEEEEEEEAEAEARAPCASFSCPRHF